MKVLVTGGAGFIGRSVCAQLEAQGHTPVVLDRASGGDILRPPFPAADHVIHLAGVLGTDELFDTPEVAVEANILGTLNMLRWCVDNDAGYTGITMPPVFPSVYTATKLCSVHLARAWHHTYGVPISHVRAFNAFGPGQAHGPGHPRKIIPAFASEGWAREPMTIWGDGSQTVDLVHVSDVGRVLVDAIRFGDDVTIDAGTGVSLSVLDVAKLVACVTGSPAINLCPMRRGEVATEIVAMGEGWDRLDWRPQFRYEQLAETVEWYR